MAFGPFQPAIKIGELIAGFVGILQQPGIDEKLREQLARNFQQVLGLKEQDLAELLPKQEQVVSGFQERADRVLGNLESSGQQERSDIRERFSNLGAAAQQNLISSGFGTGSLLAGAQTAIAQRETQALGQLDERLRNQFATFESALLGDKLLAQERTVGFESELRQDIEGLIEREQIIPERNTALDIASLISGFVDAPKPEEPDNDGAIIGALGTVGGATAAAGIPLLFSDARLKKNIENISFLALESVLALRGVQFDWQEDGHPRQTGLIAQEVEKIFPEWVTEVNGVKTLNAGAVAGFAGVLVEALRELRSEKDEQISKLENRIAVLESMITSEV